MPELPGFVTIGKAELVVVLIGFVALGALFGVLLMVIVRLVKEQPGGRHRADNQCKREHLTRDAVEDWLQRNDFTAVTNEVLSNIMTMPTWPKAESDAGH